MSEPVRLVEAEEADLPAALEFVRAYFQHDGLSFGPAVESAVAELLADRSLGRFWFIDVSDVRSGYLVMTFGFDHEFGGRIGLITDFFLRDGARGKGAGSGALGLALAAARDLGLHSVELYVLDENVRARALYERLGFESVQGRRPMSMRLT